MRLAVRLASATHGAVDGVVARELEIALDGSPVRALRFRAVNYGTIPKWHPGAGGEAFIFVDELLVRPGKP